MRSSSLKRLTRVTGLFLAAGLLMACSGLVFAQEEADTTTGETPAAQPTGDALPAAGEKGAMGLPLDKFPAELQKNFADMVHYYRIARFDLAANLAEAVLAANPGPTDLLMLVERPNVGYSLLVEMAAADAPELSQAARKLMAIADQGIYIQRRDRDRIRAAIGQLSKNERAYELSLRELQASGEYVVPDALAVLADSSQVDLHPYVKRALREIGHPVVTPLVMALETPNNMLKETIINLLSSKELGYREALPAMKVLVESPDAVAAVKDAAKAAIVNIGGQEALESSSRKLYYDWTETLYYNRVRVVADPKRPTTDVWGWVAGTGLTCRPAPTNAVHTIMAAQQAQLGLRANPQALELVSLWLSVQMQMKAELLAAASDAKNPWAPPDVPTTEFFARAVGQQYLLEVLDRALRDQNIAVATQAIQALEQVANQSYLGAAVEGRLTPLVRALEFPDRMVRFSAAFAIVAVQPRNPFFGADRVVPVLAEAVNLEAGRGVLIIDADQDNLNRLKGEFRQAGWNVADATTGNVGLSRVRDLPRIDAVLVASNVANVDYTEVIQNLRRDFATMLTPIILLSGGAERVTAEDLKKATKYVDQAPAGAPAAEIAQKVDALQQQAGGALAETEAENASLRAAGDLELIAKADLAFKAAPARSSLLAAAAGKNDKLAVAAMAALVQMPDPDIQQRLAEIALAEPTPKPVRIAALNATAQIARHIGNKLQEASVADLLKRADAEQDDEVRDAVGTVLGALDLAPQQASTFILEQAAK